MNDIYIWPATEFYLQ